MDIREAIAAKRKHAVGYDTLSGGRPFRSEPIHTTQVDDAKIIFNLLDVDMPNRVVDNRPLLSIWMTSRVKADKCFGDVMSLPDPTPLRAVLEKGCTLTCRDGSTYLLPALDVKAPIFLAEHAVKSVIIRSMGRNKQAVSYDYMPPMFENICGSTACARVGVLNEHLVKKSKTSFGTCHEVFTVHGNMTIREDKDYNSVVSFKGARDVRMVYKMVNEIIGLSCLRQGSGAGDDVFNVHMAVVTALLGKRLCVYGECVLERIIVNVARSRHRQGIEIQPRLRCVGRCDDCVLHACVDLMGVPCRDENNMVKLKVLCWKSIYDALGLCCNFEPPAIENTVTVTAKGAVIIRLSWDKGILWNKHVEGQILSVCSALCALITECC